MASTKTKAVVAIGLLDIARQVATAWSAKRQAEQQRIGFGKGLREDARQLARDARDRLPDHPAWGIPPWRNEPTARERVREWAPMAVVVAASSAAVIVAAHLVAKRDPDLEPAEAATDSKVVGAVVAGSKAIDAGVAKVVEGGSAAAVGTASAVAAGSTAVKAAAVDRTKEELDERVVQPAKKKAVFYGSIGIVGLTAYVIVIAVVVQLVVGAIAG